MSERLVFSSVKHHMWSYVWLQMNGMEMLLYFLYPPSCSLQVHVDWGIIFTQLCLHWASIMASDTVGGGLGQSNMQLGQLLSHSDLQCLSQQGQTSDLCQIRPQNNGIGALRALTLLNTNRMHKQTLLSTFCLYCVPLIVFYLKCSCCLLLCSDVSCCSMAQ